MPLKNGYGVVIGTVVNHYIESPDSEGRWPHYHIKVSTPAGIYECVVNLKSRSEIKIEYKDYRKFNKKHFSNILSKPDGFYRLESNSKSGALDVIRHRGLKNPLCCFIPSCIRRLIFRECECREWKPENGINIIQQMRSYLKDVKRIYIFGEPYDRGLGVHNVHMNQGDPIGSTFSRENGIWQDGGVMFEYEHPNQQLCILLTKFQGQSLNTDELGRPRKH